jgi:rSAM/selenodomain-associated transferase 1
LLRTSSRALLIFTRNPVPGQCKTRLAASVGQQAALDIYLFLLRHTATLCAALEGVDKKVYFSEPPEGPALWDPATFEHHIQEGADLGMRMQAAFVQAFNAGYSEVVLIGSDLYDLGTDDLRTAFTRFSRSDVVLGPAKDGGYYLIGLKKMIPGIFAGKAWGSDTVLRDTLSDLSGVATSLLPVRNDIDTFADIQGNPVFEPFLNARDD